MPSQTTNKFSPEVRERSVRMVLDHEADHPSRWAAVQSVAGKIGCSPHTLLDWVKKADRDGPMTSSLGSWPTQRTFSERHLFRQWFAADLSTPDG